MEAIDVTGTAADPPAWAHLERRLLDLFGDAVDPVLDRYTREDGSLLWPPGDEYTGIDALDDAYESVYDWPLAYLLGGDERLLEAAKEEWEAITEQFSKYDTGHGRTMVVDEYEQGRDWFHQGEGNLLFYFICMADPDDEAFRERARRFAEFYLPGAPGNYDPEKRIIRSPQPGSAGPAYYDKESMEYSAWMTGYGVPVVGLDDITEPGDLTDPANADRMGEAYAERASRGDVPQNLAATSLVTTAYLLTDEDRYREWVLEYVDAWRERTAENDGIIPDNVGLTGEVGENTDGAWYGGYYGWTFPHGWHSLGGAAVVGAENAALLRGDDAPLDMVRSTLDALADRGIEHDGTLHVPHKHGDEGDLTYDAGPALRDADGQVLQRDGWFEFKPIGDTAYPTHVWYASAADDDRERLERLRAGSRERDGHGNWDLQLPSKYFGGHEYAWLDYLAGEYPEYPSDALAYNLRQCYARLRQMAEDDRGEAAFGEDYLQHRNPISTEALVQLTMGAPQHVYYGGLQYATVRHFDPTRERPGLPEDVAALVTDISSDSVTVTVTNLGARPRRAVLQAGGFAEHRFGTAIIDDGAGSPRAIVVDDDALALALGAGTGCTVEVDLERHAGTPTLAAPWDRQG